MNFSKPSKIQERALPLLLRDPYVCFISSVDRLLNGRHIYRPTNMIGQSQSGTGKTAAFVLTMLSRVDYSLNKPQVRLPSYPIITNVIELVSRLSASRPPANSPAKSWPSSPPWANTPKSRPTTRFAQNSASRSQSDRKSSLARRVPWRITSSAKLSIRRV